ncbi:MAG: hypothetical protein IKX97_00615, partial [Erysipelotrichaceae bacterium]|nr:hypothetical protein [Erysipelotrichaceae bacterium]
MKIILADDENNIYALRDMIQWDRFGLELSGVYNDGKSLLNGFEEDPADILLYDADMDEEDSLQTVSIIRERYPGCRC